MLSGSRAFLREPVEDTRDVHRALPAAHGHDDIPSGSLTASPSSGSCLPQKNSWASPRVIPGVAVGVPKVTLEGVRAFQKSWDAWTAWAKFEEVG